MTKKLGEVTYRHVFYVAMPIVLSNATVPILGAVDTGVVGQLGDAVPIAAVGVGAIILSAVYWIFGFLRMGTVGLAGLAFGAGQTEEVSAILTRSLLIAAAGGLLLIALQVPIFWAAFQLSPVSAAVEEQARIYMFIRMFSAPAAIAIYAITGWLIAQERTGAVLVIQLWMNGLNILLDLVFVLGLGYGVEGVAVATFLAEWTGLGLGLYLCRDNFQTAAWRNWVQVLNRTQLMRMASLNTDILIRSFFAQIMFVSFLVLGGRYGDVTLAANQVLLQFVFITSYALDGFTFAAQGLVGPSIGAKDRQRLRRSVIVSGNWSVMTAVLLALVFWIFGPTIIEIMAKNADVQRAAGEYLPYMIAAPVLGVAAWFLDGVFISAARGRDMRNMMFISFVVYCAALLLLEPRLENHGLWLALLVSFVARGITLGWRYPSLEKDASARV